MATPNNSEVYRYPEYYALGYRWNTEAECDFIEACLEAHAPNVGKRLLDLGCGTGRHAMDMAKRGYEVTAVDLSPEMIRYLKQETEQQQLPIQASVGDLRDLKVDGTHDVAICFMDTFRFLLTNEDILAHLRAVAQRLVEGGLYLVDFWIPRQWDQAGNEIFQWEQTEGDKTVRVFYLQHPDTIDPVAQTFEDELVFQVTDKEQDIEIRGGPTRTRLILPQEWKALVEASGVFSLLSSHSNFDLAQEFDRETLSWRMVSVLKKHS